MALELLSHMFFFRVRHLPDHQLQLRIGIHTGTVYLSGPKAFRLSLRET